MLGYRVSSFNDVGLGEPEQDANSALTELDKGYDLLVLLFTFLENNKCCAITLLQFIRFSSNFVWNLSCISPYRLAFL